MESQILKTYIPHNPKKVVKIAFYNVDVFGHCSSNPVVFLGYVTSSPKSRDYRTLIEKGRTKVNMNSFCSFLNALCYKAVLLRRQMIEDDLLESYTVHRGYSTFSIPSRLRAASLFLQI